SAVGLPTGNYFVRATTSLNYIPLQYNNNPCLGCGATSGTPVVVTAPAITPSINFTMNAGGQITGRVTNAVTGAGIGNVYSILYTSGGTFTGAAQFTNCSGDYTLSGLTTGNYKEQLGSVYYLHDLRYRSELYDNVDCAYTCSFTTAALIPVTQGVTTANI